tara:strand:- start:2454 stop:3389 length:936 start_codon:yes stop_codon:yes gene_type:complete
MKIKILIILIFINFNTSSFTNAIENKILLKIDNEIITSIDVYNEISYLTAMNKKIKEMEQEIIYKIAIKSLIKEKIKNIEIERNIVNNEKNIDELYLDTLIKNTFQKLGYNNLKEFENHLKAYGVDLSEIRNKISTESLWNEIIYKKFSKKVKIDKEKLKEKVVKDNNSEIKSFLISEIVFKILENQSLNEKIDVIKKDILEKGFSNAALLHSISNSSTNGGNIGWFNEGSLNSKIRDEIKRLKVGEYSKPIIIPGGFLILKLKDTKEEKNQYNVDEKLKELIRLTTNEQLNQLSNIYFEKVKKEIKIDEL